LQFSADSFHHKFFMGQARSGLKFRGGYRQGHI